jgi:hypothetical protein
MKTHLFSRWAFLTLPVILWITSGCSQPQNATAGPRPAEPVGTKTIVWNFDGDTVGQPPKGWTLAQTRESKTPATWKVEADLTAPSKPNVLALTATENRGSTYNLAIADKKVFQDIDLTVNIKAVMGEKDQGGGPIWRCSDQDNYYICRFNPLEANFRVYKVVDGTRKQLKSAKVTTDHHKWYAVRVTMVGNQITCYLAGEKMLEVTDDTFKDAGKVGFWTKADAVTSFDDLTVK